MVCEAALCSCCLLLPTKPVFVIVLPLRRSLHPSLAVSVRLLSRSLSVLASLSLLFCDLNFLFLG